MEKRRPGNPNIRNIGFGSRPREVDDEYRSRQKGVPHKRKWTKEICVRQLEEIMDRLKSKIEDDDFKELQIIVDKMMDIIRYLYPPVQQTVNVNVDTTIDKIINRIKEHKLKQGEIVVTVDEKEKG